MSSKACNSFASSISLCRFKSYRVHRKLNRDDGWVLSTGFQPVPFTVGFDSPTVCQLLFGHVEQLASSGDCKSLALSISLCRFESYHDHQIIYKIINMRVWWNWYTRWSKKPMPSGLRVQISPCAPRIFLGQLTNVNQVQLIVSNTMFFWVRIPGWPPIKCLCD